MTRLTTIGIALALGGGLAGCAAPVAKPAVGRPAIHYTSVGLERVLG